MEQLRRVVLPGVFQASSPGNPQLRIYVDNIDSRRDRIA